jgi:pyrroloquinoline quinone (PQQ) biosynthesis protein C
MSPDRVTDRIALPTSVSDPVAVRVTPHAFTRALWAEVEQHPALTHPFLRRFAEGRLARWQIWGYAAQHYQLVCLFTAYPEAIAGRTPDPEVRRLLREILEDEYMGPQAFERSHPALSRRFMRAVGFEEGAWDRILVLPATRDFVMTHLDMTFRSWLEALGAAGPGHEWATT